MTIKEAEAFWLFVGQMKGVVLILENLGKCLDSKSLKDLSTDIMIKINEAQLKMKEARKDE